MAKPPQPGTLNPLALRGVDLASLIGRSPVTDEKGQKVHVTPAAISNWVSRDGCPRNPDGTYNAIHVLAWLAGQRARVPYRPNAESDDIEKEKLAVLRERKLTLRQNRLADAKTLVDREEVREEWMRRLHSFKSGLLTLARVLAREVVGQPGPVVQKAVDDRVNDVLRAYSEGWDGDGEIPTGEKKA
jgi:hypothetical protein